MTPQHIFLAQQSLAEISAGIEALNTALTLAWPMSLVNARVRVAVKDIVQDLCENAKEHKSAITPLQ